MPTQDELERTAKQMKFVQDHVIERDLYDMLNIKVCVLLVKRLKNKFPSEHRKFDRILDRLKYHLEYLRECAGIPEPSERSES